MRVLVTGANGLLGRSVVAELLRRGHRVRALVRPVARTDHLGWSAADVEVVRADLRAGPDLLPAFAEIDTLIHLAAAVTGGEDLQFASTVVGTERLLDAMARSDTRCLVLASSFSVYDWSEIEGELTEDSPVEADVYGRDGYAVAKIWQERLVRRVSRDKGWALTVLRPGFIWGAGNALIAGIGQSVGPAHIVIAPRARLPLTHVANCADAFVTVAEKAGAAAGETFNVVDGHDVTSWRYMGLYLDRTGSRGFRVPLPYWLGLALARAVNQVSKRLFRGKGKLPSLFVPARFEARFKPLRFDYRKLREKLGWSPPLGFDECVRLTYRPQRADGEEPLQAGAPQGSAKVANG